MLSEKELPPAPKIDIFIRGPIAVQKRFRYNGKQNRIYDPSDADKKLIRKQLAQLIPEPHPHAPASPTTIELNCIYPPLARPRRGYEGLPRGDVDNTAKIYLDCLSKILFGDDRQVTTLIVTKAFGNLADQGIHIRAYW